MLLALGHITFEAVIGIKETIIYKKKHELFQVLQIIIVYQVDQKILGHWTSYVQLLYL